MLLQHTFVHLLSNSAYKTPKENSKFFWLTALTVTERYTGYCFWDFLFSERSLKGTLNDI